MGNPDGPSEGDGVHMAAAMSFVRRVRERNIGALESLILFGSTVRKEADGIASNVDFLTVVSDDADTSTVETGPREIAYDVMLDHGPVVEVHVLSQSSFDRGRDHPFIRRLMREGETHV